MSGVLPIYRSPHRASWDTFRGSRLKVHSHVGFVVRRTPVQTVPSLTQRESIQAPRSHSCTSRPLKSRHATLERCQSSAFLQSRSDPRHQTIVNPRQSGHPSCTRSLVRPIGPIKTLPLQACAGRARLGQDSPDRRCEFTLHVNAAAQTDAQAAGSCTHES